MRMSRLWQARQWSNGASSKLRVVELLSDSEIESRLAELDGWEREGETIVKTFERADFVGSVEFVGKLVEPAEEMGHHPGPERLLEQGGGLDHHARRRGADGERLRAREADRRPASSPASASTLRGACAWST